MHISLQIYLQIWRGKWLAAAGEVEQEKTEEREIGIFLSVPFVFSCSSYEKGTADDADGRG